MSSVVIQRVKVQRMVVLSYGRARMVTFTPAETGPIRVTCDVGAGNCRVEADLRDGSGVVLDTFNGKLRDLVLTATPTIDPTALAHFSVHLRNEGIVEGDGVLSIDFLGRLVEEEIALSKLNHLVGVTARNEINPRIVLHPGHMELMIDERFASHVPEKLKKIPRTFKKVVTFEVEELRLGKELLVDFAPAAPRFPNGSLRVTATIDKVRVKAVGVPLGGADHGRLKVEVGFGRHNERLAVTNIEVHFDWDAVGIAHVVDLRNFAAAKLDDLLESLARSHVPHLMMATNWLKKLLQLDEFLDLQVTTTALAIRGIGAPVAPPMPSGPIATPPSGRMQHLVVVMMENRSFDHMLGDLLTTRPHLGTLPQYREEHGDGTHRLRLATTSKVLDDPPHGSGPQLEQAAGRYVAAYVDSGLGFKSPPDEVLTFQPEAHVPFYKFLADNACVCLNWRAAIPGQTWPNRNYALSGTSKGMLDNGKGGFDFYDFATICDVLHVRRPDQWRYFKNDVAFLELYRRWFRDEHHIRRAKEFHDECRAGTLRLVTWIEPNISDFGSERGTDDHPPADVRYGQGFLSEVYRSLCEYSKKTGDHDWLLVITYDEHGGFYDSKGIGPVVDDDDKHTRQRGFRVPAFLVSPWLPASVCTAPLDHASIVRTILDQFCGPDSELHKLRRVAAAASFRNLLDFAIDEHWPVPLTAVTGPAEFPPLPAAFFPPPPAAGLESAIEDGTAEVTGEGSTSHLWRDFIARRREALMAEAEAAASVPGEDEAAVD